MSDKHYYRSRATQEREMGESASDLKISALHHELAGRFEALALDAECEEARLIGRGTKPASAELAQRRQTGRSS